VAQHRHKRDANARPTPHAVRIAGPLAVLATVGAVTIGIVTAEPETRDVLASTTAGAVGNVQVARDTTVSRSQSRVLGRQSERALDRYQARLAERREARATDRAVRQADTRLWTTAPLKLWTEAAGKEAREVGLVDEGEKVLVTGREQAGRLELVVDGKSRWVTAGYVTDEKPEPPEPEPTESAEEEDTSAAQPGVGGECTNGTSVSGSANVIGVHQAVCAAFPFLTSYGTYRGDGEHAQGIAIDIMVSGGTGWEVAEYLRANYAELGISYIIYSQKIWSVDRAGEGWRYMEDRGSTTANHYDHVHVTTY
jgi:CheY-like chemotaxis protein